MTWLIIGSTAAYHWFKDKGIPKDLDLLTPAKISGCLAKVCVVDSQWHDVAEEIISINTDPVFADPDILYTLKVSHAHWDIHWDKTMWDIKFFRDRGCSLNMDLYRKLVKVWEQVHGKKKVNLNVPNEEFFNEHVVRKYDHDLIHKLAAFNGSPMYERIKPNITYAMCSEDMFETLTEDEQVWCALEEIIVTAIERAELTVDSSTVDMLKATKRAHKLLCTSMTKGWFARYLIVNHFDLLYTRKTQWLTKMQSVLQQLSTRLPLKSWREQNHTNGSMLT